MQLTFDLSGAPLAAPQIRLLPRDPGEAESRAGADVSLGPTSNDNAPDLRAQIARFERHGAGADWGSAPLGDARVDRCLPAGGLPLGRLHEIAGESRERETPAAVTGFAASLAAHAMRDGAILWVLQRDDLYPPGLQAFGVDPDRLILVRTDKDDQALCVAESALRTRGVSVVVGEVSALDLTASRRLQLVCERGGATAFMLRRRLYAAPRMRQKHDTISSATTRWRIAAAPSATDEPGLGPARWAAHLERCRGGRPGAWIMETQNATGAAAGAVRVVAELADHAAETGDGRALADWGARLGDDGRRRERAASGGG